MLYNVMYNDKYKYAYLTRAQTKYKQDTGTHILMVWKQKVEKKIPS